MTNGYRNPITNQAVSVRYEELPPALIHAVVATEDERFFHWYRRVIGVDPWAMGRAAWYNIKNSSVTWQSPVVGSDIFPYVTYTGRWPSLQLRIHQGGSTLPMQLAKNLRIHNGDDAERRLTSKFSDMGSALYYEMFYEQKDILEAYFNNVYFRGAGKGEVGITMGAQQLFGKDVKELEIFECAILAGLLKSPTGYNPLSEEDRSENRASIVLNKMLAQGYITQAQHKEASAHMAQYFNTNRKSRVAPITLVTAIPSIDMSELAGGAREDTSDNASITALRNATDDDALVAHVLDKGSALDFTGKETPEEQAALAQPVRQLQRSLGIKETGQFDQLTKATVQAFQTQWHVQADGAVGKDTLSVLQILQALETLKAVNASAGFFSSPDATLVSALHNELADIRNISPALPAPTQRSMLQLIESVKSSSAYSDTRIQREIARIESEEATKLPYLPKNLREFDRRSERADALPEFPVPLALNDEQRRVINLRKRHSSVASGILNPVLPFAGVATVSAVAGSHESATSGIVFTPSPSSPSMQVVSTIPGHVVAVLNERDGKTYGNAVVIAGLDDKFHVYAHLKPGSITVKPGQNTRTGQVIGEIGATQAQKTPALLYEVRDKDNRLYILPLPGADGKLTYLRPGDVVRGQEGSKPAPASPPQTPPRQPAAMNSVTSPTTAFSDNEVLPPSGLPQRTSYPRLSASI